MLLCTPPRYECSCRTVAVALMARSCSGCEVQRAAARHSSWPQAAYPGGYPPISEACDVLHAFSNAPGAPHRHGHALPQHG